jgi:hypothetical protein
MVLLQYHLFALQSNESRSGTDERKGISHLDLTSSNITYVLAFLPEQPLFHSTLLAYV